MPKVIKYDHPSYQAHSYSQRFPMISNRAITQPNSLYSQLRTVLCWMCVMLLSYLVCVFLVPWIRCNWCANWKFRLINTFCCMILIHFRKGLFTNQHIPVGTYIGQYVLKLLTSSAMNHSNFSSLFSSFKKCFKLQKLYHHNLYCL